MPFAMFIISCYNYYFLIVVVMDDELSPTGKSRELVLGIPVQLALAEVEPINCYPPVPPVRLDPPVVEIDTSSRTNDKCEFGL
jgi:hypothetical protein